MIRFQRRLAWIAVLTVVYFIGGKLGLTLAYLQPSTTAIWPCSGLALGAILLFGYDVWPGILLGAFLVNLTTAGTIATSAGIAVGNTLEALTGAFLVAKFGGGRNAMKRSADIFKFALLGGMAAAAIAATIGVRSLLWGGLISTGSAVAAWTTWWLGDAVGVMIVTPLLLLWNSGNVIRWRWKLGIEAAVLLICLVFIDMVVFDGLLISKSRNFPLEFLCIPFLIWAALRFEQREAALAILVLSGPAIWGTIHGHGPFAVGMADNSLPNPNESLLLLQSFLGVGAVMTLALAAEVQERRRSEGEARLLSLMDRLTGLGNYRKLIDTLEAEILRAERMNRSFVFLLLDLDGLKQVNDSHGHPAGNRALCRLANILQIHCRSIDTPARFGGDEFAMILPECGLEFAHGVAERIRDRLANDGESPKISVSTGFAVWPEDGTSVDALLQKADHALYEMKKQRQRTLPLPT